MNKIHESVVARADQCARCGELPEQELNLNLVFGQLSDHTLPLKKSLVPPGFPEPDHSDVDAMLVASDFWEERGDAAKFLALRDRAECLVHCQQLLVWASEQWCLGHPEEPSTREITREIVDELAASHFIRVPYGVK